MMLTPGILVIVGALLLATSGVPPLLLRKFPTLGQRLASAIMVSGAVAGATGAVRTLMTAESEDYTLSWTLPFDAATFGMDPLSAPFLLLIFTVAGCCSVYGNGYWRPERTGLPFFFGILSSSLAFIVLARNGVVFLLAWEIMALSNYILLTMENDSPEVCSAAKTYLISTHVGTLALFALFAVIRTATGTFGFPEQGALDAGSWVAVAVFGTAFVGCGLKAGLMPLHIWLPGAHANAPSHISAFMSGVVIKMGIYGLIRIFSFFSQIPLWWGLVILFAGIVSGVAGVIFAIAQHDIKRLLAYHSIENIGIIAMGIGMALIGQATGSTVLVALGTAGAVLHVLNHGIFKSLLFLGAGGVIHAAGTRDIDRLGGLSRFMPYTSGFFLIGAIAICGLPPLNGFVSELFIYLGLFHATTRESSVAMPLLTLAIPALALIGGLALACFVKVFGAAFLGSPRSEQATHGHEPGLWMLAPMGFLAFLCVAIGLFPAGAARLLEPVIASYAPGATPLTQLAPLHLLTVMGLVLLIAAAALAVIFRNRLGAARRGRTGTWDCGYALPGPTMQYSSSSFAEILVKLFSPLLRPHRHLPALRGIFPEKGEFSSHVPEVVLELIMIPLFNKGDRRLAAIRKLQHGKLHYYILYVFLTLLMLLAWAA